MHPERRAIIGCKGAVVNEVAIAQAAQISLQNLDAPIYPNYVAKEHSNAEAEDRFGNV